MLSGLIGMRYNYITIVEMQAVPNTKMNDRNWHIHESEAETGGGKAVSKKHLNPDEVEAVPESMEKEATESHDDQKATKAKIVSSADDKIDKEEETSERTTKTNAREDPELENFEGLRFNKN